MLAVMTMNIGYFLSVIGGIWLGTLLLGTVTLATDKGVQHC
jgi:solute carrier family 31 (copper transporter), member 1